MCGAFMYSQGMNAGYFVYRDVGLAQRFLLIWRLSFYRDSPVEA